MHIHNTFKDQRHSNGHEHLTSSGPHGINYKRYMTTFPILFSAFHQVQFGSTLVAIPPNCINNINSKQNNGHAQWWINHDDEGIIHKRTLSGRSRFRARLIYLRGNNCYTIRCFW